MTLVKITKWFIQIYSSTLENFSSGLSAQLMGWTSLKRNS